MLHQLYHVNPVIVRYTSYTTYTNYTINTKLYHLNHFTPVKQRYIS